MGYAIDWSVLSQGPNVADAFRQGQQQGRALRMQQTRDHALAAYAANPTSDALAPLATADPEAFATMSQNERQRTAAERATTDYNRSETFRNALGTYMTGSAGPVANALAPAATPMSSPDRPAPGAGLPDHAIPNGTPAAATLGDVADVVVQGRRPTPPTRALPPPGGPGWDNVVRADPMGAISAAKSIWGDREEHLKDWQHVSQTATRLLAGVRDQGSWDAGKAAARHVYQTFGVPFPDLPDEYNAAMVRDLQVQQLDIEKQVDAALAERKFEWQRQDDQIDNARSDRSEGRQELYRARSDHRAQVRFGERALDRAAVAGVRSDTSDLDY